MLRCYNLMGNGGGITGATDVGAKMVGRKVRLQKFLAEAGVASRRACEDLILAGSVTVNGQVVDSLPAFVDPEKDDVRVEGRRVRPEKKVYYLLNKPKGVVCTNRDPAGRKRAIDLLAGVKERVFPVGRLDEDSDGLLLMTNDGELAQRLTHPRYGVEKTYRVEVKGQIAPEHLEKMRGGVWLSEGKTQPAKVRVLHKSRELTVIEVGIKEGRNRQVRRMLARLGYKVKRLTRVRIGRISIRGLGRGRFRALTDEEVRYLKKLAGLEPSPSAGKAR